MKEVIELLRKAVSVMEEKQNQQNEDAKVLLSSLVPGETFHIGEHEFIVLAQTGEETNVISKGFIGERRAFDDESRDYGDSSLAAYMDQTIQPMIEAVVGEENLVEHEVELTSVDMQHEFDAYLCKVRPLTFDEARKYNNLLVNPELSGWYWTCTPWSTKERGWEYSVTVVSPSGYVNYYYFFNYGLGVRPFCILKSNIFVSR